MQDFSDQPGFAAALGVLPLALVAVVLVFALIGTRAANPGLRRGFRLLAWACGLVLAAGAVGLAVLTAA